MAIREKISSEYNSKFVNVYLILYLYNMFSNNVTYEESGEVYMYLFIILITWIKSKTEKVRNTRLIRLQWGMLKRAIKWLLFQMYYIATRIMKSSIYDSFYFVMSNVY